jgi:hypothetical protein
VALKNKNRQAFLRWRFVGGKFSVSLAVPLRRQAGEKMEERIKPGAHGEDSSMNRAIWQICRWHLPRLSANNRGLKVAAQIPTGVMWSEYCYT